MEPTHAGHLYGAGGTSAGDLAGELDGHGSRASTRY